MKAIVFFAMLWFLWTNVIAQAPQSFKYQAVVRDNSGSIIANIPVFFRISILTGSPSGSVVYREVHTEKTTNTFGLVDLEIGKGTPELGTFSSINWGLGSYFIEVEIFPSGTTVWQEMGTSQLLSVPFALYAKDVQNNDDADADATNEIQSLSVTGNNLSLSKGGGTVTFPGDNWGTQVAKTNVSLTGQGTDLSPLGVVNSEIKPSWGNVQSIPAGFTDGVDNVDDADNSTTNEIQVLSKTGDTVTLSKGGGSFTDAVDDNDADPINEIQELSIIGSNLSLSKNGGTVVIPGDNWGSQVIKTSGALTGQGTSASPLGVVNSMITPSWGMILNMPIGFADGVDNVDDADNSVTNEIQVLSKTGNTVTLSKGGGSFVDAVDDADNDATNEIQALSISGNNLSLSRGGGTVTIPGDNWGTQSTVTNASLSGNGTVSSPLKIAQQSASSGQVLKWNGTDWKPAEDAGNGWTRSGYNTYYTAGNVGIGTNVPDETLTVDGDAKISGDIIPNGKIIAAGTITIQSRNEKVIILAGTNKITIDPSGGVTIESNNITLSATGNLNLTGNNVKISGNAIDITSAGNMNLKSSATLKSEAGATNTIKGALVTIN